MGDANKVVVPAVDFQIGTVWQFDHLSSASHDGKAGIRTRASRHGFRRKKERKGGRVAAWQASGATPSSIASSSTADQQRRASTREEQQKRRSERGSSSGRRGCHDSLLIASSSQGETKGQRSGGNDGKEFAHNGKARE